MTSLCFAIERAKTTFSVTLLTHALMSFCDCLRCASADNPRRRHCLPLAVMAWPCAMCDCICCTICRMFQQYFIDIFICKLLLVLCVYLVITYNKTLIARIQYAVPSWSGMCLAANGAYLGSALRRSKYLGYCSNDLPFDADMFNVADDEFFHRINTNSNHVLQPYLPDKTNLPYQLRARSHHMTLINKTKFLTTMTLLHGRCTTILVNLSLITPVCM